VSVDRSGDPALSDAVPVSVPLSAAFATWAVAWSLGSIVAAPVVVVATGGSVGDDLGVTRLALVAVTGWAVLAIGLVVASRRSGTGRFRTDFAVTVRPVDLLAIPVGVVGQFVVVPAAYVPLRALWPDTFDPGRVSERAEALVDGVSGVEVALLVAVVAVGAPVMEELVYRGLLQRSAAALVGPWSALVATSLLFAVIHFSPVEYPGLFLAGLLFGGCLAVTGRLGPAVIAHAAFNAAGLYTVLR
jgi:hypothetical protein